MINMGRVIRTFRKDNHLTQADVAKALGISQQGYARYEKDFAIAPAHIVEKLSAFYDVPDYEFYGLPFNEKDEEPTTDNYGFASAQLRKSINLLLANLSFSQLETVKTFVEYITTKSQSA